MRLVAPSAYLFSGLVVAVCGNQSLGQIEARSRSEFDRVGIVRFDAEQAIPSGDCIGQTFDSLSKFAA